MCNLYIEWLQSWFVRFGHEFSPQKIFSSHLKLCESLLIITVKSCGGSEIAVHGHLQQAGVIEEMVNDGLDSALDNEDMEEETEEEVNTVLEELAVETLTQLPATGTRRERIRQPVQSERVLAKKVHYMFLFSLLLEMQLVFLILDVVVLSKFISKYVYDVLYRYNVNILCLV